MVNVFALELRVADLEQPARVAQLLESVRASGDNPGYVFVVMFSSGLMRYYPVRLALEADDRGPKTEDHPHDAGDTRVCASASRASFNVNSTSVSRSPARALRIV
jgi:hypothetical protein